MATIIPFIHTCILLCNVTLLLLHWDMEFIFPSSPLRLAIWLRLIIECSRNYIMQLWSLGLKRIYIFLSCSVGSQTLYKEVWWDFPGGVVNKNLPANAGDMGSVPGLGKFCMKISSGIFWSEWCWSWSSSTLATSCEELTHWKRLWCWEGLGAGGEGDDRGWDGWMASLTLWTWVWVNSGSWWWTGRPGVLWFMGSQRVGHD